MATRQSTTCSERYLCNKKAPSSKGQDGMDHFLLAVHSVASVVFANVPSYTIWKRNKNTTSLSSMTEGAVTRKRLLGGTRSIVMSTSGRGGLNGRGFVYFSLIYIKKGV